MLSLNPEQEWLLLRLQEGRIGNQGSWETVVRKKMVVDDYVRQMEQSKNMRRASEMGLSQYLKKVFPTMEDKLRKAEWEEMGSDGHTYSKRGRVWHLVLPTLEEARAAWENLYGPTEWLEETVEPLPKSQEKPPF